MNGMVSRICVALRIRRPDPATFLKCLGVQFYNEEKVPRIGYRHDSHQWESLR